MLWLQMSGIDKCVEFSDQHQDFFYIIETFVSCTLHHPEKDCIILKRTKTLPEKDISTWHADVHCAFARCTNWGINGVRNMSFI